MATELGKYVLIIYSFEADINYFLYLQKGIIVAFAMFMCINATYPMNKVSRVKINFAISLSRERVFFCYNFFI